MITDRTNCTDRKATYPSKPDHDSEIFLNEMQFTDRKLFFTYREWSERTNRAENIITTSIRDLCSAGVLDNPLSSEKGDAFP